MGVVPAVARISNNVEVATKLGEFCEYVRHWAGARGAPLEAAERARAAGVGRVGEMLARSAVSPLSTGDALSEYPSVISALLAALPCPCNYVL